jgi:hypothetical protein
MSGARVNAGVRGIASLAAGVQFAAGSFLLADVFFRRLFALALGVPERSSDACCTPSEFAHAAAAQAIALAVVFRFANWCTRYLAIRVGPIDSFFVAGPPAILFGFIEYRTLFGNLADVYSYAFPFLWIVLASALVWRALFPPK